MIHYPVCSNMLMFLLCLCFPGPSLPQLGTQLLCQILAHQIWGEFIPSAQNVDITTPALPMVHRSNLFLTLLSKPASVLITLYSSDGRQCKIHLITATPKIFQVPPLTELHYFSVISNFFCLYEYSFSIWPLFTRNSQSRFRVWPFSLMWFLWVVLLVHTFAEFVRSNP